MNRRRMMMLQNKGFELVYDALSGELPQESDGWDFKLNRTDFVATVPNDYLKIESTDKYHNWRNNVATLTTSKPQDLSKSREVAITFGDIERSSGVFCITNLRLIAELSPARLVIIKDSDGNELYRTQNKDLVEYQTFKISYNANDKTTKYYIDDELRYTEYDSSPVEFNFNVSGSYWFEIAKVTYKEW